jgi:hypothetical protein
MFNTICKIGIFIICAQTIINFRPKGSYEKYLKLLMGVMILIQLISPIATFFGNDTSDFEARLTEFDERLQMGIYNFTDMTYISDDTKEDTKSNDEAEISNIDIEVQPVEINIEDE